MQNAPWVLVCCSATAHCSGKHTALNLTNNKCEVQYKTFVGFDLI